MGTAKERTAPAGIHDDGDGGVRVEGEEPQRNRGDPWIMHMATMCSVHSMAHNTIMYSVSQYGRVCMCQHEHRHLKYV